MSEICSAFGCVPSVAEQQDLGLVRAVVDYRNATAARDWINEGQAGFDKLAKAPELLTLLLDLTRAQTGQDLTMAEMLGIYQRKAAAQEAKKGRREQERAEPAML